MYVSFRSRREDAMTVRVAVASYLSYLGMHHAIVPRHRLQIHAHALRGWYQGSLLIGLARRRSPEAASTCRLPRRVYKEEKGRQNEAITSIPRLAEPFK